MNQCGRRRRWRGRHTYNSFALYMAHLYKSARSRPYSLTCSLTHSPIRPPTRSRTYARTHPLTSSSHPLALPAFATATVLHSGEQGHCQAANVGRAGLARHQHGQKRDFVACVGRGVQEAVRETRTFEPS
jgi:hypothetical protein